MGSIPFEIRRHTRTPSGSNRTALEYQQQPKKELADKLIEMYKEKQGDDGSQLKTQYPKFTMKKLLTPVKEPSTSTPLSKGITPKSRNKLQLPTSYSQHCLPDTIQAPHSTRFRTPVPVQIGEQSVTHVITQYSLPRGLISQRKTPRIETEGEIIQNELLKSPLKYDPKEFNPVFRQAFSGYLLLNKSKFKKFITTRESQRQVKSQSRNHKTVTPSKSTLTPQLETRHEQTPKMDLNRICWELDSHLKSTYETERYQQVRFFLDKLQYKSPRDMRFHYNRTPKQLV